MSTVLLHAFSIQLCLAAGAASKPSWSTYYSQGVSALTNQDNAQAEEFFRKALSNTSSSGSTAEREKCMLKLADTLSLRNKTSEAQVLYENLLAILSRKYGPNSAQIAPILLDLGSIQEAAGDHSRAISYYQRALQINEKNYGPYSPNLASNLQSLGRAKFKAGYKSEAEQHFKRSLDVLNLDPALSASTEMENIKTNLSDLMKSTDNSNQDLLKDFQSNILNSNGITTTSPPAVQIKIDQRQGTQSSAPTQSAWQQESQDRAKNNRQWETNEESKVLRRGIENLDASNKLSPAFNVINDSLFKQDHYEKGEAYYQRMIATDLDSLGSAHPALANDLNGLARLYISQ
ncbi:MAG: tetratricopeptide repeat protein, partial [Candidatus Obscuribacterales bacterium]|nr:tetratricopeptide repeat protein [Candidatus Obscuribacterales bacterium]